MLNITNLIIPICILFIIIYGALKKDSIYESFLSGAKEGLLLTFEIIPTFIAMIFAINMFINSNIITAIMNNFSFIKSDIRSIIPMALMRPISGSATLAILNNIFSSYGPDSLVGRLASTIQGCTDTTFYVIALYFGSIKITKTRYAIIVGLAADLVGILMSIFIVYLFFN